jgi:hypothetical protein
MSVSVVTAKFVITNPYSSARSRIGAQLSLSRYYLDVPFFNTSNSITNSAKAFEWQ